MSDQIFFCGDVHGDFRHVIRTIEAHRPAAAVFLGDLQAQQPLDQVLQRVRQLTDIWWIHGNHDTDSDADFDHLFGSQLADRNLHGRVVEIAGLRVAGLGGVFRAQVWAPPGPVEFESAKDLARRAGKGNLWRGGLPRRHYSTIFPADYDRLASQRADILVTHEAPGAHPNGWPALDELARSLRVRAAFHGHQHDCLDYSGEAPKLGFAAYGVGLRGITDQDGRVILPGELDAARRARQSQVGVWR